MAWKLTIAGADQTSLVRRGGRFQMPDIAWERNVRGVLRFDVELAPAKYAPVIAYAKDGVTKVFGGVLLRRDPVEVPAGAPFVTRCEVKDWLIYAEWCYWTKSYAVDVTLAGVLADFVAEKLSAYGLSLSPSQPTGPTLTAPVSFSQRKGSDVLRDLFDATGYVPAADPDGVLSMRLPGSVAAPVSLTEAALNMSRLTWHDSSQVAANVVIGTFGPSGVGATPITHAWTAQAGVFAYALEGLNVPCSVNGPNVVDIDGLVHPVFAPGIFPGVDYIEWDYTLDDGTLTFRGTTQSLIAGGETLTLSYYPQYPFVVEAASGASPRIEALVRKESIVDYQLGLATVTQALAAGNQDPRVFNLDTVEDGFFPLQLGSLTAASRGLSAPVAATVTRVRASLQTDEYWLYAVEAEETTKLQADYIGEWKQLLAGSGGSATIAAVGGSLGGASAFAFPLGGARYAALPIGLTRTPVIDWLPFVAPRAATALVRVTTRARAAGVGVTPVLTKYNAGTMSWDELQAGAKNIGTSAVEQEFSVVLAQDDVVRLEYVADTADGEAYAIGQIRIMGT